MFKRKPKALTPEELEVVHTKDFFDMILPGTVKFLSDHYIVGDSYRCVWVIREYPPSTEEQAILSQLADRNGVTIRIYHRLVEAMEQRKIIQNATRRNRLKSGGNDVNETIEAEGNLQDVIELLANLRKNKEPLLHCSVFMELKARNMDALKELQSEIAMELTRSKISVDRLTLRQKEGFLSVLPVGMNMFGSQYERVLPASSAANLYPFNFSGKTDPQGLYIGRDKYGTNILVDFDRRTEDKTTSNILILGNSGPDCWIFLDRNRLKQVWMNFLTNAVKCTHSGHIKMGYSLENGGIKVYVEDSGVGIPYEVQNRVFGRFQKLNEFAQGTGLGLAISRAIIEGAGGEIGFTSTPGVGSTFWAWIPCDVSMQENIDPKATPQPTQTQETVSLNHSISLKGINGKDLQILIAEDNDSNYSLVKHILKEYQITRVVNGVEAVEKVRDEEFDIVLMDMKMPIMGGLEATRKIRELNPIIPIIALTANAFDADRVSAMEPGFNAFLTKPLKKEELLELFSFKL